MKSGKAGCGGRCALSFFAISKKALTSAILNSFTTGKLRMNERTSVDCCSFRMATSRCCGPPAVSKGRI